MNTRQEDQSQYIRKKIQELFGIEPRPAQLEAIQHVSAPGSELILIARTGFGKSLIFQAPPLLHSPAGICMILMPLKALQNEQNEKLYRVPGARPFVLSGDNNNVRNRRAIGSGRYTHGK